MLVKIILNGDDVIKALSNYPDEQTLRIGDVDSLLIRTIEKIGLQVSFLLSADVEFELKSLENTYPQIACRILVDNKKPRVDLEYAILSVVKEAFIDLELAIKYPEMLGCVGHA